MAVITLPNTGLVAGYLEGEAGWAASMNRNLRVLDALVNLRVISKNQSTPPGSPTSGIAYIIGPSPSGAWAGKATQIALWMAGDDLTAAWTYVVPKSGWRAFAIDEAVMYRFDGGSWGAEGSGGGGGAIAGLIGGTGITIDNTTPGYPVINAESVELPSIVWNARTSNYTLQITDANNAVEMTNSSDRTIAVPANASVAFPIGCSILIASGGAGIVTVAGDAGVTIYSRGSDLTLAGQYSMATLVKRATNSWYFAGDLS